MPGRSLACKINKPSKTNVGSRKEKVKINALQTSIYEEHVLFLIYSCSCVKQSLSPAGERTF
jgi:hypothetical protein